MAVSDGIGSLPQTRELFTAPGSLLGYDPYFQQGGIVGVDQSLFERASELSRELSIPFVEALRRLREGSAETPAEGPTFGQTPTSWDPLGIEGYQAMQTSIPSWGDLFSSAPWSDTAQAFPTAADVGGIQSTLMGAAFPNMGLASGAFLALASKAGEARAINRIRSQFPELDPLSWGEAMTRSYPGLTDEEMTSLAGYSAGAGEGMYTGFPAPGETRGARAPSTELGWTPGDRAYDITTDLTRDAIANPSKWGLPTNAWGYATHADLWSDKYAIGGKLIGDILTNQGWDMALTEPEWDFQIEPMTFEPGTWANPEHGKFVGELSTVGWTNPNVAPAYQSLPGYISTAGMTHAEDLEKQKEINAALEHYMEVTLPKHSLPMQELMTVDPAVHHAATAAEAAAKTEAERTAALQLEENKYWNLVKNLPEEQHAPPPPPGIAGTVAGLGYMWGGGQGEDDSYGFGSMDDTDYGMGY